MRPASVHQAGARNFGLDLARALAIGMVYLDHMGATLLPGFSKKLIYTGAAGVELFFALSGLLIGGLLIRLAGSGVTAASTARFLGRRWLRTLPLYVATILALSAWMGWFDWRSLLFLQWIAPSHQVLVVSWSLVLEEYFYLAFPLLLLAWRPAITHEAGAHGAGAVLCVALGLIVVCGLARLAGNLAYPRDADLSFYANPIFRLDCAAYGVVAAWLLHVHGRAVGAWLSPGRAWLVVAGVVAAMVALEPLTYYPFPRGNLLGAAIRGQHDTWQAALFAPLVLVLAVRLPTAPGWLGRPAAAAIGGLSRLSYAIYLLHVPLILLVPALWRLPSAARVLASTALVLAAAALAHALIERPFLALRDHRLRERRDMGLPDPGKTASFAAPVSE